MGKMQSTMEQQWFQIALKTYFWVGFASAIFCVTGIACLATTKYYHDQGYQRHLDLQRDYQSYRKEIDAARIQLRETYKLLHTIQEMKRGLEEKYERIEWKDAPEKDPPNSI